MKKLALALMTAAFVVFGFGGAAHASSDDDSGSYPPGGVSTNVSDPTPAAGSTITVTVNCTPGENVTVTLGGATAGAVCGADGTASIPIQAPATAGTATGTATGDVSGDLGTFTVEVAAAGAPTGGLPATGSDGIGTTTWIAGGLLIVGLGLFAVATVRRRQPTVA